MFSTPVQHVAQSFAFLYRKMLGAAWRPYVFITTWCSLLGEPLLRHYVLNKNWIFPRKACDKNSLFFSYKDTYALPVVKLLQSYMQAGLNICATYVVGIRDTLFINFVLLLTLSRKTTFIMFLLWVRISFCGFFRRTEHRL